jgi:hypothetical protein
MKPTSRASRRRRRAIEATAAATAAATVNPPAPRKRRRTITQKARAAFNARNTTWHLAPRDGLMGAIHERPFYACRYAPGGALSLPFNHGTPFSCLLNASIHISDEQFRVLAEGLLGLGMRQAICAGIEGERLSDLLNDLLEDGSYHLDGRTAYTCAYEEEPIEEVMELFALPCGTSPANLLVSIGNETMYRTTLRIFSNVAERMKCDLAR